MPDLAALGGGPGEYDEGQARCRIAVVPDDGLLRLVRTALEAFETTSLAGSARRALRIATLRGDSEQAWWMNRELRPVGGSVKVRAEEAAGLWPDLSYDERRNEHGALLEEWIAERTIETPPRDGKSDDPRFASGSIDEIESHIERLRTEEGHLKPEQYELRLMVAGGTTVPNQVLGRIRHRVFEYLCRVDRELTFGSTAGDVVERHRRAVDSVLSEVAPDALDKLNAAYRRVDDGDPESLTHALTSCRRVLVAIADRVYPPRSEPVIDDNGDSHPVTPEAYLNRLEQFVRDQGPLTRRGRLLLSIVDELRARLRETSDMTSKAVHDEVTAADVDLALVQTYVAAGEILSLVGRRDTDVTQQPRQRQ